jgi:ATP-binding cassette subfamily B protein
VVAHRLSTVRHADEILFIVDDGIAERGNHRELLTKGGMYARLYKMQHDEPSASASSTNDTT